MMKILKIHTLIIFVLCKKNDIKDFFKFSSEIKVNEIGLNTSHNTVYVIASHNDLEDEHSLWVFKELNKS